MFRPVTTRPLIVEKAGPCLAKVLHDGVPVLTGRDSVQYNEMTADDHQRRNVRRRSGRLDGWSDWRLASHHELVGQLEGVATSSYHQREAVARTRAVLIVSWYSQYKE